MGVSRQEYWSGLPFPSPGDLPDLGIKPTSLASPALAGEFFTNCTTWEAQHICFPPDEWMGEKSSQRISGEVNGVIHGNISAWNRVRFRNSIHFLRKSEEGTSLVVQWLRLYTPKAGAWGSIPGQGTRSHIPQLKDPMCCN